MRGLARYALPGVVGLCILVALVMPCMDVPQPRSQEAMRCWPQVRSNQRKRIVRQQSLRPLRCKLRQQPY